MSDDKTDEKTKDEPEDIELTDEDAENVAGGMRKSGGGDVIDP